MRFFRHQSALMDFFFKRSFVEPKPVFHQLPTKAYSDVDSPSQSMTIAIAISGSTKSKNIVKWALKKFSSDKNVVFKLIHVHLKITCVPAPCKFKICFLYLRLNN